MDIKEYSHNRHEQILKENNSIEIPAKYKIKIVDNIELRIELEKILEELPQSYLAKWSLENAHSYLNYLDEHLKNDTRIKDTERALYDLFEDKLSVYELRKNGFLANKLGQESITEISKYSARVFAQSIASGHMRAHAIVSSDYGIKVINLLYPEDDKAVIKERNNQINLAKKYLERYIQDIQEK